MMDEESRYRGVCIGCGTHCAGLDDWEGGSQWLCTQCQHREEYEEDWYDYLEEEDELEDE